MNEKAETLSWNLYRKDTNGNIRAFKDLLNTTNESVFSSSTVGNIYIEPTNEITAFSNGSQNTDNNYTKLIELEIRKKKGKKKNPIQTSPYVLKNPQKNNTIVYHKTDPSEHPYTNAKTQHLTSHHDCVCTTIHNQTTIIEHMPSQGKMDQKHRHYQTIPDEMVVSLYFYGKSFISGFGIVNYIYTNYSKFLSRLNRRYSYTKNWVKYRNWIAEDLGYGLERTNCDLHKTKDVCLRFLNSGRRIKFRPGEMRKDLYWDGNKKTW